MRTATPPVEYAPIFNWSPARSRRLSLISFITASVLLHAFCFYIFQIVYPPTVALLPPPARVNFITPDSEEGRVLLRWIEAEDPALSSITQRSPEGLPFGLPKTEHVPSYFNRRPSLKGLPPAEPDLRVPSSSPPAPVALSRPAVSVTPAITPTEVVFSSELAMFGAANFPPHDFIAATNEPPQAAQFRVGISARGQVRYCLLENSSGDSHLDDQARRHLVLCRFPAAQEQVSKVQSAELHWGTAIFEWGNDLATASPASRKSSAP